MRILRTALLTLSIILFKTSFAQRNCAFPVDTVKILANENLDEFIKALKVDSFKIFNRKKKIPKFIRTQLECYGHGFSIADSGKPYTESDIIMNNRLPRRQLVFLAISQQYFVMQYYKGGFARSKHIVLIRFKDGQIVDLWKGICMLDIETIPQLAEFLDLSLSKGWTLNTNVIYF